MDERRTRPEAVPSADDHADPPLDPGPLSGPGADLHAQRERTWIDGLIPWTSAALVEAFATLAAAGDAPADAADLDPDEARVRWFLDRYGEPGGRAHALRFYLARRFLVEHAPGLARAGLLRRVDARGAADPGGAEGVRVTVTAGLTRALATLPFSVHMDDPDGEPCDRAFDPAEVVRAARAYDGRAAGN